MNQSRSVIPLLKPQLRSIVSTGKYLSILLFVTAMTSTVIGQSYIKDMARQSARSDIRTGGAIEKAELTANDPDLRLTVNVPSFDMTLWQSGKEVRKYYVGVGLKAYPIFVGLRDIKMIIWNPAWIPPSSDWVAPSLRGKVIGPADRRNPLGKIKIPLGYGYLIHQAKGTRDLGGLVSHGCVRVMRNDLYDLNDRVLKAQGIDLAKEVANAKRTKRTFVVELEEPVKLEVTYDPIVFEEGMLHIYPDVYGYRKDKVADMRAELKSVGIEDSGISDATLKKMLAKARGKTQYVVSIDEIRAGNYLKGKVISVVPKPAKRRRR